MSAVLAPDHKGMKIDFPSAVRDGIEANRESSPTTAFLLAQLETHLNQIGKRWYAGDQTVVDEFLQLYCIAEDERAAAKQAANGAQP